MTDLEMTKKCAEAMGYRIDPETDNRARLRDTDGNVVMGIGEGWIVQRFDPLNNDEQAMALVKRFHLSIGKSFSTIPFRWWADHPDSTAVDKDLNRAIVECIAALKSRTDSAILEAK
jgi:hypothetical protein